MIRTRPDIIIDNIPLRRNMTFLQITLLLCGVFTLNVSACPQFWEPHGVSCYHFSHDKEDWPGALQMCEILGGNLVEITSQDEDNFINSKVLALHQSINKYEAFTALTDLLKEGSWRWMVSGTDLTNMSYSNWKPGQPDNSGTIENCGTIEYPGVWTDDQCYNLHYYICERPNEGSVAVVG